MLYAALISRMQIGMQRKIWVKRSSVVRRQLCGGCSAVPRDEVAAGVVPGHPATNSHEQNEAPDGNEPRHQKMCRVAILLSFNRMEAR